MASLWAVQKVKDRSVHFSHQQIIWLGICTDRGPRAHFSSECLEGWVRIKTAASSCSLSPALAPLRFLVHKRGAAWLSIRNSSDTFCQAKQEAEFLIWISYRGHLEDLITDGMGSVLSVTPVPTSHLMLQLWGVHMPPCSVWKDRSCGSLWGLKLGRNSPPESY